MTHNIFLIAVPASVSLLTLVQFISVRRRLNELDKKMEFLVEAVSQKGRDAIENDLNSRLENFQRMKFSPMRIIK